MDIPLMPVLGFDGNASAVEFSNNPNDLLPLMYEVHPIHEIEFGKVIQITGFVKEFNTLNHHAIEQSQILFA